MFRMFTLSALTALGISATASAQVTFLPRTGPSYVRPGPITVHHYHVQYRLPWEERIFANPYEAQAFERRQELWGYQANTTRHGGHYHVRYRLPGWETYRTVGNDFVAHELERQLELRGYEARVVHH